MLNTIDSVASDIGVDAVKIGMIGSAETAAAVAERLTRPDLAEAAKWYRQAAEYPASESHYWDPEKVARYNAKGRAALQRLGGE